MDSPWKERAVRPSGWMPTKRKTISSAGILLSGLLKKLRNREEAMRDFTAIEPGTDPFFKWADRESFPRVGGCL